MFSISLFGYRGPILRNKYILGMIIDTTQMSFHSYSFLANEKACLSALLT